MGRILLIACALAAVVGLAGSLTLGRAARSWSNATEDVVARLFPGPVPGGRRPLLAPGPAIPAGAAALDTLPAPVRRFMFQWGVSTTPEAIVGARLQQEGRFRVSEGENTWRPFTATEWFRSYPPGFVWDAEIRAAPGASIRVRDAYLEGTGRTLASILGLVTVADVGGSPEIAAGALQRYLAEAMWFPTRLRPGNGLTWQAIDDSTARATLRDGTTVVALDFRFTADGRIERVTTDSRWREVKGEFVKTPWDARVLEWGERGGWRIPARIEVAWTIDGVRRPYWIGSVTAAEFGWTHRAGPSPGG